MERKVLIIGAGSSKQLPIGTPLSGVEPQITTLDIEPRHKTDVVWDLNVCPWPFPDNSFDELHAYEVLEHLGQQGDAKSFFAHFYEAWRILRPDGFLCGSVPLWNSEWALGDPSHRRVISPGTLTFLDRTQYEKQVGKTTMTDFRSVWHGDFDGTIQEEAGRLFFLLQAHKPVRA